MRVARRRWGRAMRPGPSVVLSVVTVLVAIVLAGCGGGGARYPSAIPGKTVAHYPSFLPKKTLDPDVDAALTGTEAKPALQVEGLPVEAKTKAFDVDDHRRRADRAR